LTTSDGQPKLATPSASTSLPPLASSLKGGAGRLLSLLQVRLELLSVEARMEFNRLVELLVGVMLACLLGCMGLGFLAMLITVALWDSHRLLALTAFSVLFLTLAGVAVWQVRTRLRQGSQLFAASLAELQQDRDALQS